MTLRTAGAIGLSAVALTAFSTAAPAAAVPDCGTAPAGGTLTVLGGTTCEVDFSTTGSYTWSLPTGVTGLQALLAGGGGGAASDGSYGYAGNGGRVRYVDYSGASAASVLTVNVGAGGLSLGAASTSGAPSQTILGGVMSAADGGDWGNEFPDCRPEGSFALAAANGHSASTTLTVAGVNCESSYAAGLNPAAVATDSYGTARPTVFADLVADLGAGGRIIPTAGTLPADASLAATGAGASAHFDLGTGDITDWNDEAGSGRVVFRYTISAAVTPTAPALAATGIDAGLGLGIAGGVAALGAALLVASRRRKDA
jgi:LPXTG-motif cell wall-anchored protein